MDLGTQVEGLRQQVAVAADAVGPEAQALIDRLMAPLEAAIRLTLQDTLAAAAEEITTDLAPGSVELRVRGRELEFVVTLPPPEPGEIDAPDDGRDQRNQRNQRDDAALEGDEGATARINLRLPEQLKARVEAAAARDGQSVNAWLVRAAANAVQRADPSRGAERRSARGTQRYTGWAR
jgi:hypothetical protein